MTRDLKHDVPPDKAELAEIRSTVDDEIQRVEWILELVTKGNLASAGFELGQASMVLYDLVDRLTAVIGDEGVME